MKLAGQALKSIGPFPASRVWFWDCLQPVEGRSKRIGASAQALIRNALFDDCVLGVDEFPVPALAVTQDAIEEVRGLVGKVRTPMQAGARLVSLPPALGRAVAGDGN